MFASLLFGISLVRPVPGGVPSVVLVCVRSVCLHVSVCMLTCIFVYGYMYLSVSAHFHERFKSKRRSQCTTVLRRHWAHSSNDSENSEHPVFYIKLNVHIGRVPYVDWGALQTHSNWNSDAAAIINAIFVRELVVDKYKILKGKI